MNLDDLLKKLNREYLAAMPEKIADLEKQLRQLDVDGLRQSFHKLKGTGRTYGLPEVSVVAELVENICIDHPRLAVTAGQLAVPILRDIYQARQQHQPFACDPDLRVIELRKLLQNGLPAI